jgi:hypothetical protein
LWIVDRLVHPRNYVQLLLQLVISGLIYVALVSIYFYHKERPGTMRNLVSEHLPASVSTVEG